MSSDQLFGRDPDRTLAVHNACRTVIYPKDHAEDDSREYTPCLALHDSLISQAVFRSPHRKYILQDACTGTQGYLLRELDSKVIDYEILQHWLRHCKRHHTECTQTYDSVIPGLKVIDCTTGKVTCAPDDPAFHYVALSYVWGGIKSSEIGQDRFPVTICDAITVTIRLGYRYLWVDQYVCGLTFLKASRQDSPHLQCIDQLAVGHKQAQIQLMGRIYAEAELVIVAAAGDSSNYGLPGVGMQSREIQRRTRLENDIEIMEMNEPDDELDMSTWAQRGWTHQEGYLATRRLVFTDTQVLYVCNQGAWQESVQRPVMADNSGYLKMFNDCFPRPPFFEDMADQIVYDFLDDYSKRELSYDSDILNACIGVLNRLVSHYHFWGMVAPRSFRQCRPLCLTWRSWVPGKRRAGYPSWSWVGTTGPKRIKCYYGWDYVTHIRTTDGHWLPLEEQPESRSDPLPVNFGPTLRLRATLYTASLSTNTKYAATGIQYTGPDTKPEEKSVVVFQSTDGDGSEIEIVFKLWLDSELTESDLKNAFKAILAYGSTREDRDEPSYSPGPVFMIIQAVGHHYKRIGITDHEYSCWILEKRTGILRERPDGLVLSYEACKGSEETIYIE